MIIKGYIDVKLTVSDGRKRNNQNTVKKTGLYMGVIFLALFYLIAVSSALR